MTQEFEVLTEGPQTGVKLGNLGPDERQRVRKIDVSRSPGGPPSTPTGAFTTIYYVAGEERAAAAEFVAKNRDALEAVNLTGCGSNVVSTSVPREIYDWILHELGERRLTKYETVVVEYRPTVDATWCIGRRRFETGYSQRYSQRGSGSARVTGSLESLFDSLCPVDTDYVIAERTLRDHDDVVGDVREVLDALRQIPQLPVTPVTDNGELAVRVQPSANL
ncbi:hypothetical protein GCM10027435_25990 [Haloparvum alkalitolerans]|uniref:hypothetical protein n=1 Tax=Haloparvum alkalitolerans TaxID=1042953 RepID=UPI003CF7497F